MSRALALAAPAVAVLFMSASAPAATKNTPAGPPAVTIPTVSIPTVSIPTVSTPITTTPAVTTPIATVPSVTVAPPAQTLPKPPVETAQVTATPTPPAATVGSPAGGTSSSGSSPASIGAVDAAHRASSRSKTSLAVTRFHLARPATVRVAVWQEAPQCRLFGRFGFTAARGTNAFRLPLRIAKHPLVVGTYRLLGLVHGRTVIDERVRVVRANGRLRVRKIHAADGCVPSSEAALLSAPAGLLAPSRDHGDGSGSASAAGSRGATKSATAQSGPRSPQALPRLSASVRHTLIFVLLGLAITLLAASSLPGSTVSGGPAAAALARHRAALTSAGLAMIVAAALALVLT